MVLDFRIDSGDSRMRPIDPICYGFLLRVGTKLGTAFGSLDSVETDD